MTYSICSIIVFQGHTHTNAKSMEVLVKTISEDRYQFIFDVRSFDFVLSLYNFNDNNIINYN